MIEQACAMGEIIVKPYLSNGRIYVDTVLPESFFAVDFSGDTIMTAVFPEQLVIGKYCYTRLEYHRFDPITRCMSAGYFAESTMERQENTADKGL